MSRYARLRSGAARCMLSVGPESIVQIPAIMSPGDRTMQHNVLSRREFLYGMAGSTALAGALSASVPESAFHLTSPADPVAVPDKLVVLTFDDAVKSHWTFVAPFLKDLGFRATFLVSHRWMNDHENFMTWQEIAKIHQMGFEIGNHTWTHDNFSSPRNVARLGGRAGPYREGTQQSGRSPACKLRLPGRRFWAGGRQDSKAPGIPLCAKGHATRSSLWADADRSSLRPETAPSLDPPRPRQTPTRTGHWNISSKWWREPGMQRSWCFSSMEFQTWRIPGSTPLRKISGST